MNAGRYTIKSFLTDHNLQQILIPEIQRDYVWKTENVDKLLDSILADAKKEVPKQAVSKELLDMMPVEMREQFERSLETQKTFTNVGFLYAYHDTEIPDRYMLIDGQQRMTTLFLILLAIYIKDGKSSQFSRHYFSGDVIKLDYRVRENSHNFLFDFIAFLLKGGKSAQAMDEYWFYDNYEQDQTIQSLFRNYQHIEKKIAGEKLALDYVENQIEFWYFDTNQSAQGEELYLYMNSRGESVQSNENIKANLLENISEGEKDFWGEKWEEWQQLFWINKGDENPNADLGFDEFLKWIKIIENTKSGNTEKASNQTDYVKTIRESKTFSTVGLEMQVIERYIAILYRILGLKMTEYFGSAKLNGRLDAVDYILILSLLVFMDGNPETSTLEINRFCRFFSNVSRFEVITKNPYMHIVQALGLTRQMIAEGTRDIADIRHWSSNRENILTPEERMKLAIYAAAPVGFTRAEIEGAFWEAEDYEICDGRIKIIWDIMGFELTHDDPCKFDFTKFESYKKAIDELFDQPCDLLRRALLTKGDYAINNGYTYSLVGHRYSFGYHNWKAIFEEDAALVVLKDLMGDYVERAHHSDNRDIILAAIIADFLSAKPTEDWVYAFVKHPSIMHYCRQKMVCFSGEEISDIYLLQEKKAATYNYQKLSSFIPN